ncbi:MAG: ABC transporter permease, partial [Verrucomicrobiae bacterium]|nr:ABC transporter permease [Verrucomicrobiae bacterium]
MKSILSKEAVKTETVNKPSAEEARAHLSQSQLIWRRFSKHRLGRLSMDVLICFYLVAIFAEFVAPINPQTRDLKNLYCPPQIPLFSFKQGLYAHVMDRQTDPETLQHRYTRSTTQTLPLSLFAKGETYKIWGLIPLDRHLIGLDREAYSEMHGPTAEFPIVHLLGADKYGRDIFARVVYGSRISLSIGLVAIAITLLLGISIGGISGYVGGVLDNLLQRAIEILNSFPKLPLWLALGAILPKEWSALATYFAITIVLSMLGWTQLARVVRGKILALREEDYAVAAQLLGASHGRIIFRHLLPGFTSHIIVVITLSIPNMILGETALSFLGLGLRPPIVSWGVMLQDCMNVQAMADA